MKLNTIFRNSFFVAAMATASLFTGCTPDEVTEGNPLTQANMDASFTSTSVQTVDGSGANVEVVSLTGSNDPNIQYHVWKVSNENGEYGNNQGVRGGNTMQYTFDESGTYKIEHRVVGRVGGSNSVTEVTVTVALPEPPPVEEGPNLIQSPNFEDPSDWTVLNITAGAAWTFNEGSATIAGATGHQAIYQAIQVEAGKTYEFDMNVAGPGSANTWFEVYVSPTAPTPNSDYSAGGKRIQLNTWAGCATSAFDGLLSDEQCGEGDVSGNVITFDTTQTVYFLIKCGSGDGNINSITVSNVTFHEVL